MPDTPINPPVALTSEVVKVWTFVQNADGTLSPGASGGGGGGAVDITQILNAPVSLANPLPIELSDGTQAFGTASNPLNDNVAKWGGTAVAAATAIPPVGTEAAPVVRPIQRKFGYTNNTQLGNGGVFRGPGTLGAGSNAGWVDTQQTGGHFLNVSVFSDQTGTIQVQRSDDYTVTGFTQTVRTQAITAGIVWMFESVLKSRYWRVVFTNNATPTNTFEVAITESTEVISPTISGCASSGDTFQVAVGPTQVGINNETFGSLGAAIASGSGSADQPAGSVYAGPIVKSDGGQLAFLAALNYGATTGGTLPAMSAFRIPNIFKTAQATASGNTAVWTPTSGKKFRLMRFMIQVTGNSTTAAGGVVTVSFQDSASDMAIALDVFVPATAVGDDFISPWVDLGNGKLSAVANNVLNVNLSSALTAGNVRVTCCGTEE